MLKLTVRVGNTVSKKHFIILVLKSIVKVEAISCWSMT